MKSLLGALDLGELNLPRVGPQDAVAHGGNPKTALPPQDRTASLLSKTSRM
ncbi:MAG: hypothetical protein F6K37_28475 [Moorea sp. SIO4E2]|uniref:hypothetical protein n=1 Tax=Moorena sp. SIO4E2 TaxID=2607826 RepID=UPI0013BA9CEA|nr:hypothetical protein [Moorena sp. SIO4E2]NEQ09737.1 hypothetical protein [Moorena sp. SIO4E2]